MEFINQFVASFHALGYSAINLVLIWLVAVFVVFRVTGLTRRAFWLQCLAFVVLLVPLMLATNFLADQNRILNEAIREDGGLKRTFPENQTAPVQPEAPKTD